MPPQLKIANQVWNEQMKQWKKFGNSEQKSQQTKSEEESFFPLLTEESKKIIGQKRSSRAKNTRDSVPLSVCVCHVIKTIKFREASSNISLSVLPTWRQEILKRAIAFKTSLTLQLLLLHSESTPSVSIWRSKLQFCFQALKITRKMKKWNKKSLDVNQKQKCFENELELASQAKGRAQR